MTGCYGVGAIVRSAWPGEIYRLVCRLGDGATASVFEADDLARGERVALKLLRRGVSARRLQSECTALQALAHPNIVRLLSFGFTRDGAPYLVMPLLIGAPLRAVLDDEHGALGIERSLDYATEMFVALDRAHTAGLLHRDIRPGNLLLERLAPHVHRLVLLDFGLSCAAGAHVEAAGARTGDPAYAAPELFSGRPPSFASDLYAAGLVLFEMLTGRRAYGTRSDDWGNTHVFTPAPRLGALVAGAPVALQALVASLLAKDPRQRPASAAACAQTLCAIQQRLVVAGTNATTEDAVDSVLRCIGGPDPGEITQVDAPPASLLREASGPDDTDKCEPPSSSSWRIPR